MVINIRKSVLERIIEQIPLHPSPKVELEQYLTPSEIVAEIVFDLYLSIKYSDAIIVDLGCGTGRFAIAAALMKPRHVICVDVDYEALEVAIEYAKRFGVRETMDFIQAKIPSFNLRKVTVVLQNPPFGVHKKHADIMFLEKALKLNAEIIYSIHKSNKAARKLITKVSNEKGYQASIIHTKNIVLPPFMKHHFKVKHKVLVDIYKIVKKKSFIEI